MAPMKCVVVQADGLGDEPIADLGGKTPLEAAQTPHLDVMASKGLLGLMRTIPDGVPPSCDAGSLAVLGYDPGRYRTACGPLEAIGRGVALAPGDVAFRLDLVTIGLADDGSEVMRDATGGGPTVEEAAAIVVDLARVLGGEDIEVCPGSGHRHGLVWRGGECGMRTVPAHALVGKPVAPMLPSGPGADRLRDLMARAKDVLAAHPLCEARRARGAGAPNAVWPWGQGVVPRLPALPERFPLRAAAVPGGDLERGLARLAGIDVVEPTPGNGHGPLAVAVGATLAALDAHDFVILQLGEVDDAGHQGDVAAKIAAIERLDAEVVGPLLDGLRQRGGEWRLGVLADHPTPCATRTHSADPVPFVVYVAADEAKTKGAKRVYHERDARELGIFIAEGYTLIERLLRE